MNKSDITYNESLSTLYDYDTIISDTTKYFDQDSKFIDRFTKFKNSFFIQKAFKQWWIENKPKEGGAFDYTIKLQKQAEIILTSHTKKYGKMYSHVKTKDLNALVAKQNGLYENINNFPHKVYFDLDVKIDSSRQIDSESNSQNIVDKIVEIVLDPDIAVSGSKSDSELSYHITLNNHRITNQSEREQMKRIVGYLK